MGKYIVRNGVLAGRKFRLEHGASVSIGREKGDLNFPDKRMSRRHCVLEARDDGDHLEDSNSTNGTFVNEERVKTRHLKPGDIVRVGFTEIEFLGMPEHTSLALTIEPGQRADPNKTIAFRRSDVQSAVKPRPRPRQKSRARARFDEVKKAAMGLRGAVKLISAKGKFCEACGEAIFMKEGAPDEGRVIDGLYLCRMCALIAEKQKDAGGDYLPSYAKIVGGRMGGPQAPASAGVGSLGVEIASVDEISLDELGVDMVPVGETVEEKAREPSSEGVQQEPDERRAAEPEETPRAELGEGLTEEEKEETKEEGSEALRELKDEPAEGTHEPAPGEVVKEAAGEKAEEGAEEKTEEKAEESADTEEDDAPPPQAGTRPSETVRHYVVKPGPEAEYRLEPEPASESSPEAEAGKDREAGVEPRPEEQAAGPEAGAEDTQAISEAAAEAVGATDGDEAGSDKEEAGGGESGGDDAREADSKGPADQAGP